MVSPPDNSFDVNTLSDWLAADALVISPRLLGCELISRSPEGTTGGRIVEVEAYHGTADPASHAFRGLTPRTAPMFAAGGAVYLYRSYGIHTCMNIVTGPAGEAQAVLIRALEPTIGLELMARRRRTASPRLLASGPGRVGQALGLTVAMSGQKLNTGTLELRPPSSPIDPAEIVATTRIGIKVATENPWRFYLASNLHVSRP